MRNARRFEVFTLRRLPFLLFISAGVSGMSLTALFQSDVTVAAVFLTSLTVIIASIAARLRDIGFSAWWTPLGIFPTVAILIGVKASGTTGRSRSTSPAQDLQESRLR